MKKNSVLFCAVFMIAFMHNVCFSEAIIRDNTIPAFELIDRTLGLSNLSVSSMIQDNDGFIWFGTQGGLNRYDGRDFKVISNNPFDSNGLLHNLIQTMYYDSDTNSIWLGTYQGISVYNIGTNTFENYTVEKNNLSNSVIITIIKDKNGYFWVGTLEGLNRIDPITHNVETFSVPGNVVRDLLEDSTGRIVIGSYEGLLYFNKESSLVESFGYDLPSKTVMVVNEFEVGIFSLGLWDGGIVDINLKTGKINNQNFDDNRVYSYIKTSDETKWIGTWGGGLYAITSNGEIHHFEGSGKFNELSHPIVYSLYQDTTGILWVGTNGGGVCKVNPMKRNYVQIKHDINNLESLSAGKINSIYRDRFKNLWIAVYNAGISRFDETNDYVGKYVKNDSVEGTVTNDNIVDIIEDTEGRLLFSSGDGIQVYDYEIDQFMRLDVFEKGKIVYALENGEKHTLWIGTYNDGLYLYSWDKGMLAHYFFSDDTQTLSNNLVYDILLDSKGRLWVATNDGLNLLEHDGNEFAVFKTVDGDYNQLASNTISTIFEDSKNRIWFGTHGGGVSLYNETNKTFTTYVEGDGMPSNVISGILEGEDGRIWVSTENGIAIINAETKAIFVLTPDDGIGGYEFNAGHFKDSDGTLMFGGLHGITAIPSNFNGFGTAAPKTYITEISVFQKLYDENIVTFNDLELKFKSNETFLGFKFVAINFDSPEKTRFSYKLINFDKDWIHADTRNYASYSNIPPGEYELQVVSETSRGIKSQPAIVKFTIATPWYLTIWAYSVYVVILCVVVFGVFKVREAQLLSLRNNDLSKINEKLEEANVLLESLSTKDPLIGVYNRRYFNSRMEEELHLAVRSHIELTLIMLDLDNFKDINDQYGHLSGDQLLKDIGNTIIQELPRSTDFVVRFGGDEFLIVLYDTNEIGALTVANHIKVKLETVQVLKDNIPIGKYITTSIGVLTITPSTTTTAEKMVKSVDDALYQAKNQGKNRICVGSLMD